LTLAALASKLDAGFMEESITVEAARRKLSTMCVERQNAITSNPFASFDERATFSNRTETHRFHPEQRENAEAVVKFSKVNVSGCQ
jgi:hypothetical protein